MAAPEGYALLGRVGFVDRGDYQAAATYRAGDVVYSGGSSFVSLKDNLKGIAPTDDHVNWKYMARGLQGAMLSALMAEDASGLAGSAGGTVNAQTLVDAIANKVATQLLKKTDVISQIINDATKAASAAALYAVNQNVAQLSSDLSVLNANLGMRYEIIEASKQLYKNAPTPMCNKWLEPGTYLLNTSLRMDLTVQSLVEQLITVGDVTDQNGSAALTLVPGRHFFAHTSVIVVTDTSKNVVLNARYYDGTENLNIVAWLGITKIK